MLRRLTVVFLVAVGAVIFALCGRSRQADEDSV